MVNMVQEVKGTREAPLWKRVFSWFAVIALVGASGLLLVADAARADALHVEDAELPTPRSGAAAFWDGEYAYVIGGSDSEADEHWDDILRYDPVTNAFTRMDARLPEPLGAMRVVWNGEYAFLFGGRNPEIQETRDHILRYDPREDALVMLDARLPTPRTGMAVFATDEHIYLLGGVRGHHEEWLDEIVRFTPETEAVDVMAATLPSERRNMHAGFDGEFGYVFGGWLSPRGMTSEIVRYDPVADEVRVMDARMPAARTSANVVWDGDSFYVLGGYLGGYNAVRYDDVFRYDPRADAVEEMTARLPSPRSSMAHAWVGDSVLLFGGREGHSTALADVLRYTPPTREVFVTASESVTAPVDLEDVARVDAAPAEDDARVYEARAVIGGHALPEVGVFTGGVLDEEVSVNSGPVDALASLDAEVSYWSRAETETCLARVGSACVITSPIDPLDASWVTNMGPTEAATVNAHVTAGGVTVVDERISVPAAGRVLPLLP
jgi:N-acetylneuraminic acid mutarotase